MASLHHYVTLHWNHPKISKSGLRIIFTHFATYLIQKPPQIFFRYDFHLSQAVTASLPQFVLQFSAYMLVSLVLSKVNVEDPTFNIYFYILLRFKLVSFIIFFFKLFSRCCTCWRLSRIQRLWKALLRLRVTFSKELTSWYFNFVCEYKLEFLNWSYNNDQCWHFQFLFCLSLVLRPWKRTLPGQ